MTEKTTPETPAQPQPPVSTKVTIELQYFLATHRLGMLSKSATIGIEGALGAALAKTSSPAWVRDNVAMPADNIVRVTVDYDMETDACEITAQAPRILVVGTILHALGAVTRNQAQQQLKLLEQRVQTLEQAAGARGGLILPGGRPA